jgi:hypothetical protein
MSSVMTGFALVVALGAGDLYDPDPGKLAPLKPFAVAAASAPTEWVRPEAAIFRRKPQPEPLTLMDEMARAADRMIDRLTRAGEKAVRVVTGGASAPGPGPGRCCGRRC